VLNDQLDDMSCSWHRGAVHNLILKARWDGPSVSCGDSGFNAFAVVVVLAPGPILWDIIHLDRVKYDVPRRKIGVRVRILRVRVRGSPLAS